MIHHGSGKGAMPSVASPIGMTVAIPTLGKSPHLRGLLERLKRQIVDFNFEVLVVANLPSQELRQMVQSIAANFIYLETGRLGVNVARNKALDKSRGEIILFLDDDIVIQTDDILQRHWEAHARFPHAVGIGGPYQLVSPHSPWEVAYHQVAHQWLDRSRLDGTETTQLLGGNMSLKRELLHLHFDENILFGGSEAALCQQLVLSGKRLHLLPELIIGHSPEITKRIFIRKAFLQGKGAKRREETMAELPSQHVNEWLHRFVPPLYARQFARGQQQKTRLLRPLAAVRKLYTILSNLNAPSLFSDGSKPTERASMPHIASHTSMTRETAE